MTSLSLLMSISQIILLQILITNVSKTIEHDDIGDTGRQATIISVINATKNTLTLEAVPGCTTNCKEPNIVWKYSENSSQTIENAKTIEKGNNRVEIYDLRPHTKYQVWAMDSHLESFNKNASATVQVTTCPESPETVNHIYIYGKGADYIKVAWGAYKACASTAYYIRWYEFSEDDHEWPDKNEAGDCPKDGVYVANTTSVRCEDDPETICYTINENITSFTRYFIELFTTDASQKCSGAQYTYLKTPIDYWGGITIGWWCVIILCTIGAIGAVPFVIRMKRRLALQLTSKENMVFKRTTKIEDSQEDEERDPEGYLVSNTNVRQHI